MITIKSYTEAVRFANTAGLDAAKARMRKAGRAAMSLDDYNHACDVAGEFLCAAGYAMGANQAAEEPTRKGRPHNP